MKIKSKYKLEISKNLRKLLKYIEKKTDQEVENQADIILSLLRLVTDDNFYIQINETKSLTQEKTLGINNGNYGSTSLVSIKYANPERYKVINKNIKKETSSGIYSICKRNNLDQIIYKQIIENYFLKGKLIIPSKIIKLKSSEYRDKVRLIIGKPKPTKTTNEPIYLQIFSDTTQSSVIRFFRENDFELSQIKRKSTSYPFEKKFKNIKKELLCYLCHLLGKTNSEIINYVSSTYDNDINLDESNVRNNVKKFKKMLVSASKK